jgi:hypothetical protein
VQLDVKDDGSGRQHWTITPVKTPAVSPPPRKSPPPPPQFVEVPAVNYSIAFTGYTLQTFGPSERIAFCDSILNSTTYPKDWMRCVITSVTDVPFVSSGRRLMQGGSTVYVEGYTLFEFIYGNDTSQQQATTAANGLFKDLGSPTTVQTIFQPSFSSSTITLDAVGSGQVGVPENTLPTPTSPSPAPASPSPIPSSPSPSPSSPTPTPSSPTLSPGFTTSPGVITDGPATSSPAPSGGGGGGGSGGGPTATVPGVPTIGVFTVVTGGVNAAWTAPASNGGAAITSYSILCTPNTGPAIPISGVSASSPTCTAGSCSTLLTTLTPGTSYICKVQAVNSVGLSTYSGDSNLVPPTAPGVPTIGACGQDTGSIFPIAAKIRWTAPASDGGSAITSYDIKCSDSLTPNVVTATAVPVASVCTGTSCNYIMTGLLSATTSRYTCTVRATNVAGSSAYSTASSSFTMASGSSFTLQGTGGVGEHYGYAADVSADATTILIGTNGGNAAYTVTRTGPTAWASKVQLATVAGENFGNSVSSSSDGSVLVVGAPGYSSGVGKVYIYTKSGSVWSFSTALTGLGGNFGVSVSISDNGNTIVAGANTQTYQTNANAGEVFVSTYVAGSWTALSSIAGGGLSAGCGNSVSISGDGNTLVYGCPGAASQNGQAYVMEKSGNVWGSTVALSQYVTGGLATAGKFGTSVAVSKDGSYLVVGAPATGIGEAYAFRRSGNSWSNPTPTSSKLASSVVPALTGTLNFGVSVAISGDSSVLAVGAPYYNSNIGRVFTYTKEPSGSSWGFFDYFDNPAATGALWGRSLSLSDTGKTFLWGGDGYSSNRGGAYTIEMW